MVTNAYLKALSESAGFWWTDTAVMQAMDQDIENGATGVTTTAAFFMYLLTKDAKVCVHLNGSTLVTNFS